MEGTQGMASGGGRRVSLWLDEDAFDLLGRLTTVHRRGRYLSELIRRAAASQETSPLPGVQLQRIEERLERIEEKLDAPGGLTEGPEGQQGAAGQGFPEAL